MMRKLLEAIINKLVKNYGKKDRSLILSVIGEDQVPYTICAGDTAYIIRSIAETIVTVMESAHLTKSEMEQLVSLALVQAMFNTEIHEEENEDYEEEDYDGPF